VLHLAWLVAVASVLCVVSINLMRRRLIV
jgi:hypothetical protein